MPLPNTTVIPADWSQHHAPAAAGGMNATVTISNPAAATTGWDPVTESTTTVPAAPVHTGPARVQSVDRASQVSQTDQDVTVRSYLVQLHFDAPLLEQGWVVAVTECANDAALVTWTAKHPMTITDVQMGSERFTCDLLCDINLD